MVYSSSRFKYQSLIALLNANLLSISTLFCVHPEFLVILIKNLKVMFLILYCSIFKELCAALATAYLFYQNVFHLSRTFSKLFSKFLKHFSQNSNFSDRRLFRNSLFIISNRNPFVKNFFQNFLNFFCLAFCLALHCPVVNF